MTIKIYDENNEEIASKNFGKSSTANRINEFVEMICPVNGFWRMFVNGKLVKVGDECPV